MQRGARRLVPVLLILTLCVLPAHHGDAKETITITDLAERTVQVPADVTRVVCLAPGSLRLVCYLNKQDLVVGVEEMEKKRPAGRPYWLANPQLAALPAAGPGDVGSINAEPDLEALLKVSPDVVFVTYMKPELADSVQKKLGIPIVVLSYGPFASFDPVVYKSLRLVGKVLKAEERAEEIVSYVEGCRKDLKERTRGIDPAGKRRVYVGAVGFKGIQGIESTDASYVPLDWVDAKNVARQWKEKGHLFINKEQLLSSDPDVIFVDGGGLTVLKEDMQRKPDFYKGLKAFKTNQVYRLHPFNWYVVNIGTAVADAYAAGKILYPDRFADIDPAKKADDLYAYLLGKPVYEMMTRDYGDLGGRITVEH
ncbi:MAG: iron ABC transporter substrate-binding protein [Desulfomonilaceae bacterium]|nr:iron ABC transporter substrate-binding protein [Desulfomonilaceae bacterium]